LINMGNLTLDVLHLQRCKAGAAPGKHATQFLKRKRTTPDWTSLVTFSRRRNFESSPSKPIQVRVNRRIDLFRVPRCALRDS
jgi:hypothetical protein